MLVVIFTLTYPGTCLPNIMIHFNTMGRSRPRFPVVSLGIFSVAPPTPPDGTMCPEVDSASESEYQRFPLR